MRTLSDLLVMHTLQGDTAQVYDEAGQCTCGKKFYERGGNPVAHMSAHRRLLDAHAHHVAEEIGYRTAGRIRDWVRAVAYAEDDFVVDAEDVMELLDLVDPEWRRAFDE